MAGLYLHQVTQVLDGEKYVIGICQEDHCHGQLPEHQPHHLLAQKAEEGFEGNSVELAQQWAALMHSMSEGHRRHQYPVVLDQVLCRDIQHLKKLHKAEPETECSQSACDIPVIHSVRCFLLVGEQEGRTGGQMTECPCKQDRGNPGPGIVCSQSSLKTISSHT